MIDQPEIATAPDDLERWMEVHGPALFLFAQQQTGSFADAQDVYQEGILKVLHKPLRGQAREMPPLGRVFLAIKHAAIDLHRQRQRRKTRESAFVKAEPEDAQGWFRCGLERQEMHQSLQDALRSLPVAQQEVLVLKIWGEQTFRDIGEILGIPAATAATRYRSGLAQIRNRMEAIA